MAEYINYALGLIASVKLESYSQTQSREPTLMVYTHVYRPRAHTEQIFKLAHEFTVPTCYLETPSQCEYWIEQKLRSLGLVRVAAETGKPNVLLRDLIWKMKEKMEAGGVCAGVVEIGFARVVERQAEFHRLTVVTSANDMRGNLNSAEGSCCAICLDVLVEESDVVELLCFHVFHCRCIEAWVSRKRSCPYCRTPAEVINNSFWVHNKNRVPLDLSLH